MKSDRLHMQDHHHHVFYHEGCGYAFCASFHPCDRRVGLQQSRHLRLLADHGQAYGPTGHLRQRPRWPCQNRARLQRPQIQGLRDLVEHLDSSGLARLCRELVHHLVVGKGSEPAHLGTVAEALRRLPADKVFAVDGRMLARVDRNCRREVVVGIRLGWKDTVTPLGDMEGFELHREIAEGGHHVVRHVVGLDLHSNRLPTFRCASTSTG